MDTEKLTTQVPNQGQADSPVGTDAPEIDRDAKSVLVMTSEIPWPLNTGGHLRTYHLLRSLARRFDVHLIVGVERPDDPGISMLREIGVDVHAAKVGRRVGLKESWRAFSAAIIREPYVLFRRHDRPEFRQQLRTVLDNCSADILYLDHLDPFAYRATFPTNAKLVLDLHNVYSTLTRRVAEERDRWYARWYLAREARLLTQIERSAIVRANAVLAVSAQDQAKFAEMGGRNVHLIPNGVDSDQYRDLPVGRTTSAPKLLFLGALSWQPNVSAAQFLAQSVLPEVMRAHPDTVLQIVGRNPTAAVHQLQSLPGVEIHANVPDVVPYFEQATMLAVPLDSGGGTRLKILEAFAAGLPVISTPVGCEGIEALDGQHLTIRSRNRFSDGIVSALAAPERLSHMAQAARTLAAARYDWNVIGTAACDIIESVLNDPERR